LSYSEIVVNRLLDKYEKSRHAQGQGLSNRRVLLKTDRGDIPEYDYHNVDIRDAFNEAVKTLVDVGIILTTWGRKGFVLSEIWLNLDQVDQAYRFTTRESQEHVCERYILLLTELKDECITAWIRSFADDQINEIKLMRRLSSLCKRENSEISDLLIALRGYDPLRGESISIRAFSIKCYHDSKHFERRVKELFLTVARKYEPSLAVSDDEAELGWREQLMVIGLFARPELYELSGNMTLRLKSGCVDLSAFGVFGVALPDTHVGDFLEFQMESIRKVLFIENKTCYDEYLLRHKKQEELVIYQGGFISQKKVKLLKKLAQCANRSTNFYFWGDIDIGGFRMFLQLKDYIHSILPWKMSDIEVRQYCKTGMERSDGYFIKMDALKSDPSFTQFRATIEECLKCRVTIEQESMIESLADQW